GRDADLLATTHWDFSWKLEGLSLILRTYDQKLDLAAGLLMAAFAAWMGWRGSLRLHPAARFLLTLGGAVYLALPVVMMRSFGADLRLPVALLFLLIGFLSWDLGDRPLRAAFLTGLSLLTL